MWTQWVALGLFHLCRQTAKMCIALLCLCLSLDFILTLMKAVLVCVLVECVPVTPSNFPPICWWDQRLAGTQRL